MRTIALVSGFLGLTLGMPAAACMCGSNDLPMAFDFAKAVFIAEVIQGTEQVSIPSDQGSSRRVEAGEVRLAVAEVFKGKVGREATVVSSSDTSCGVAHLRRGRKYVFYAVGRPGDSKLYSGPCARTRPLDSDTVREDLRFLRNLPPVGSGGTLRGNVTENRHWQGSGPLSGLTLQIDGPQAQQFTVTTRRNGSFEVKGLPPGRYRVEPKYSPIHVGARRFLEVDVSDRSASYVNFETFIDGQLLVRITDRQGRSFNNARPALQAVQLIDGVSALPNYGSPVGAGGDYLVSGVPPGYYLLYLAVEGVNAQGVREHRQQKYFYPGTFDRGEAVIFKIGPAEKRHAVPAFRLPEGFKVRSVTGRVSLQDGRPATRTRVLLNCGTTSDAPILEHSVEGVRVDSQGKFRIDAIAGLKYWLSARGYDAAHVWLQSSRTLIEIAPGEDGARARELVLFEPAYVSGCGLLSRY